MFTERLIVDAKETIVTSRIERLEVTADYVARFSKLALPVGWDLNRATTRKGYYENLMAKAIAARKVSG